MGNDFVFYPPRRAGLIFHAVVILALTVGGIWGLLQATRAEVGPVFLLYLLPALLVLGLLPLSVYRAYALLRAYYILERDGIRLHWGLRAEEIPMDQVIWVRRVDELGFSLPLPWLRWPGAVLGSRRLPANNQVEFMAASSRQLVLIATAERAYAISPDDPDKFMHTLQRFAEMGTLAPIAARSVYPSFLLIRVWATRPARYLLLSGFILSLLLLILVSLVVPTRATISMGFQPDGLPRDFVPSVQLLLLPVVNSFFFLGDFLMGLFFFRRAEQRVQLQQAARMPAQLREEVVINQVLAYLLWGYGALTALCFLIAIYFILQTT